MLSPGFVDFLLFLLLAGATIKGWNTGFIRSVMTFGAVIGGWVLSGMAPDLTEVVLHYSFSEESPYFHIVTRLSTFALAFGACQVAAFSVTGLIENIKLGVMDKFVGVLLGVATGAISGCLIVSLFFASPETYWSEAGQHYLKSSTLFKQYAQVVSRHVRKPARPEQ